MDIGFTGTQHGMTEHQKVAVGSLLDVLKKTITTVHHGDCIGADADFHDLAKARGYHVEIHPPTNPRKRAYCSHGEGDVVWPQHDYRSRNQHIVNCSGVLIATPGQQEEVQRSGTWMTIRMARRKQIALLIVYPDGLISDHNTKELLRRV